MILSGLMSGNVFRRTAVERKNERVKRLSRASTFILLGTPSIVALIIYYFFYK
jgi:ABC-type phosphate transport system permease subunit